MKQLVIAIKKLSQCAAKLSIGVAANWQLKEMNSQDSIARATAKIFKLYFISCKLHSLLKVTEL